MDNCLGRFSCLFLLPSVIVFLLMATGSVLWWNLYDVEAWEARHDLTFAVEGLELMFLPVVSIAAIASLLSKHSVPGRTASVQILTNQLRRYMNHESRKKRKQ